MVNKIFVTQPFLPPKEDYFTYLENIFETNGQLTNQGPLVLELENVLKEHLQVSYFQYVTNGTTALQIALAALDIHDGEVITTPFSYVATTSSILWQHCKPVFVDIETDHFTIDAQKIEEKITKKTKAIMPVHVFGYACNVEKIQEIAQKYNLKIIYDGAHAFNVMYKKKSLLSYGDISTCSFHATKLFHTVEGGACITNQKNLNDKIALQKAFGHFNDNHICLGINAKQSELHAAMGLANFKYLSEVISKRKQVSALYDRELSPFLTLPKKQKKLQYNYAYYPILFEDEVTLLRIFNALNKENIFPRRYFYPSLNTLPYIDYTSCPNSESISSRICCLPLYPNLPTTDIIRICNIITRNI